ncbi:MAG: imidazoleglycerol-phosphate dehydratase [Candidatus Omnitrophica bacterium]|nr:imidazoleglycerol-phosphate dehydratase [Candidatus Omnitrophota bacterium]MDD5080802.1 imidazoleglycerol-phosphate dehydratase [Candidatus Omnitrophota bacterium]MDD5440919.1 imidazoleglycerol-phosphate dehydratase [Candidatus Omnitrophota bacterium]
MRKARIERKTNEVDITGSINIDGSGKTDINVGAEPLNHLLTLFAFHGLFDLEIKAGGDLQHHIIEDTAIALGKALKSALGEKTGINRYGCFTMVMDKVAVETAIDISGRPSFCLKITDNGFAEVNNVLETGTFDDSSFTYKQAEDFLESFLQHAGISMVCVIKSGQGDLHHILECLFKGFAKALAQSILIEPRRLGVPSTKGIID